jgi:flavin reductase
MMDVTLNADKHSTLHHAIVRHMGGSERTRVTESHHIPAQDNEDLLDAYRMAMRHVAATVFAVTARHEGRSYGILATAVSSLSFDPPSLLACINRSASLHAPLLASGLFAVNVLGQGNRAVADRFTDPDAERFEGDDWIDIGGVPVLATAQSSFVCKLAHAHVFGTHSIFIGELLVAHHRQDAAPLTYFDRQFVDVTRAPLGE